MSEEERPASAGGLSDDASVAATRSTRPMKLLIYGINYSPELTGIGKYSGDMAEWLAAAGHDVRVLSLIHI